MSLAKEISKSTYLLRNKTFTYLLPMLGDNLNHFKNCSCVYLCDVDRPEIKNKLLLLYRLNKDWSNEIDEWLKQHSQYNQSYKVKDDYWMYVFDLPENYRKNYFLFKEGKYSLFDDEYKRHIVSFHKKSRSANTDNSDIETVKKVLYKDESLYKEW